MRNLFCLGAVCGAVLVAVVACDDDAGPMMDAAPAADAAYGSPEDALADGGPIPVTSPLERPTDLPRPPQDRLPDDLRPPRP